MLQVLWRIFFDLYMAACVVPKGKTKAELETYAVYSLLFNPEFYKLMLYISYNKMYNVLSKLYDMSAVLVSKQIKQFPMFEEQYKNCT